MKKFLAILSVILLTATTLTACNREGGAEKAGRKVDNATKNAYYNTKEAVTPDNSAEKAGQKIDKNLS